jgi:hypothetical protein
LCCFLCFTKIIAGTVHLLEHILADSQADIELSSCVHSVVQVSENKAFWRLGFPILYYAHLSISILTESKYAGMTSLSVIDLLEQKKSNNLQSHDGVTVTLENGETRRASMCVVTAPLNTLHAIHFEPPLSPIRREVWRVCMCACTHTRTLALLLATIPA